MKRLQLSLLTILLITGCQTGGKEVAEQFSEEKSGTKKPVHAPTKDPLTPEFEEYLKSLPAVELPLSIACDQDYPNSPEVDKQLRIKFTGDEWEHPYRRIPSKHDFSIVLNLAPADVLLPVIKTYRNNGEVIASQQMFFNYCGGEPGYFNTEHIIIQPDLEIVHIDSTRTYELNSEDIEIEGTEKLEVKRSGFQITDEGKIVKK